MPWCRSRIESTDYSIALGPWAPLFAIIGHSETRSSNNPRVSSISFSLDRRYFDGLDDHVVIITECAFDVVAGSGS